MDFFQDIILTFYEVGFLSYTTYFIAFFITFTQQNRLLFVLKPNLGSFKYKGKLINPSLAILTRKVTSVFSGKAGCSA